MAGRLQAFLYGASLDAAENSDGVGYFTSPDFRLRVMARRMGPRSYRFTLYRGSGSGNPAAYYRISRAEFERLLAAS